MHSKTSQKVREKCWNGQRFICTEVTSYKIHTLEEKYNFWLWCPNGSSIMTSQETPLDSIRYCIPSNFCSSIVSRFCIAFKLGSFFVKDKTSDRDFQTVFQRWEARKLLWIQSRQIFKFLQLYRFTIFYCFQIRSFFSFSFPQNRWKIATSNTF